MRLRAGDEVVVIAGKYKGKVGKLKKVIPKESKVLVEGVGIVKKHVKPDPNRGIEGGVHSFERPIHCSNVAIYDSSKKAPSKIKFKLDGNRKIRVYASSGKEIK